MKALSIKQPFAALIVHGIKDIENRTWKTNYRGKIYIHASSLINKTYLEIFNYEQRCAIFHLVFDQCDSIVDENGNLKFTNQRKITSAIIGDVEIVDCVVNHDSIWAIKTEIIGTTVENETLYRGKPTYNWVLANPVLYKQPIFDVKGKLSFWNVDEQTLLKIKVQNQ